jgi:hypothetical protein
MRMQVKKIPEFVEERVEDNNIKTPNPPSN